MTFYNRTKKTFKRGAKAATKAAGKRYGVSYGRRGLRFGKNSVSKLAKDVMMIKSRLNVEKKFVDGDVTTASVGAVNINNPGYYAVDITPTIPQGTGENQRIGNSVKLTGFHQKYNFIGQTGCYQNRRLKIMMIQTTDVTSTNDQIIEDMFDENPLTGNIDYFSNPNYSNMKRAHKVIARKTYTVRGDSTSGLATSTTASRPLGDCQFGNKMQHLTRFEGNAANSPKDQRYLILIFCDYGNRNGSSGSNAGSLVNTGNSGLDIQHHYKWWLVDN